MSAPFVTKIENAALSGATLREITRALLEKGKPFRFTARGYSMSPFIQDGDTITLVPFAGAPQVGEVVAVINPVNNRLLVHRLVSEAPTGYLIKGDNLSEPDGVFVREQLLGRVVDVAREGRKVRGGLGLERVAIAFLSRQSIFLAGKAVYFFLRRQAGAILHRLQNLTIYRALGRKWQPRVVIIEPDDNDLAEVQRRFNPDVWLRIPQRVPNVTYYIAKTGNDLAGYVELVRRPPEHSTFAGHWLFSLHVWPRFRGLGLGELLTRRVIEQAQSEGAQEVSLIVNADNTPAISLYKKLGFTRFSLPEFDEQSSPETRQRVLLRVELTASEDKWTN